MATWTTAEINNLPDSSFFYIAPGGKKDSDGKTTPRSLRFLPYKDASGKVDMPHVDNAKARLGDTDIPAAAKTDIMAQIMKIQGGKSDNDRHMFKISKIELDSNGQLPTRIMLLQSGNWPNSVKGNFTITPQDLQEVKDNFDKGVGFPTQDASTGLAIDFKHEYDDQAAAWIKGLQLEKTTDADGNDQVQLFADPVEWSEAGAKAVQGGQFKCISPSGYFGKRNNRLSMWPDPQNLKNKIANVLDGAGLTNIPFLRGMSPIRASATDDGLDNEIEYDKVIFISEMQQTNKEQNMQLDQIRVKEATALSAEEKKFLLDNAAELDDAEREKFSIKQAFSMGDEPAPADDDKNQLSAEDKELLSDENRKLLADVKAGNVKVIKKDDLTADQQRLSSLEATAEQYRTEKADGVVALHIKRGAIKQDAKEFWTKQLLSADGQARLDLEAQLEALPSNEQLAKEIGSEEDTAAGSTARDQLSVLATKKVEAAAKDGKELLYSDALKLAIRENPDLQKQDLAENKVGA